MGSSTSKKRAKTAHHQEHLPKVGTPENAKWEQKQERKDILRVFGVDPDRGNRPVVVIVGALLVIMALLGMLGLILFT